MPRDVAGLAARECLRIWKTASGESQLCEHLAAAPDVGDQLEDGEVGQRLARRAGDFLDQADPPLGVDERALLLAPAGGRQQRSASCAVSVVCVHVLHDQEIEPAQHVAELAPG